jgi:hypothetical protein
MHKIMKLISKIIFTTFVCINVSCGQKPASAKSNATVKVLDSDGKPLAGISVRGGYLDKVDHSQGFGSATHKVTYATTNHLGIASLSNTTRGRDVYFGIDKADGYYEDYGTRFDYTSQSLGVWQPDNPLIEFKLKPIKNPIPLYAKNVKVELPTTDEWYDFDFEVGDFVKPHGRGEKSDVQFLLQRRFVYYHDYESKLQIKFPNEKDGAVLLDIEPTQKGSILKMPYLAPENGYSFPLIKEKFISPQNPILKTDVSDRNFYFFRVRTTIDQQGNLISANYAKIHNDFKYDMINSKKKTAILLFTYYYNPTPNDRNLEFDMKRNLFKKLTDSEAPIAP